MRFSKLEYRNSNLELFQAVYQNSLYEINFDNLKLILQQVYGIENENAISHKNYTQILTQPNSPLAQYIDENISEYLDVILLASNGTIFDDESAALSILNNIDVTTEQKHAYIETLRIAIVSIKMVNDISLWKPLLNNGIAMCSEENIMEYFCAIKSLDKIIIDFINSCRTVLDFTEVLSSYGDEKAEELFDAVTICNSLENQKYKQILVSLGFMYEYFDISNIFNEKLVILIDENIIKMNPKTLDFIRKNYGSQALYFIQKHLGEYTEMMTTDLFSVEELEELIKDNLSLLCLISYLKLFDTRSRPKFEINTTNERLLTAFKKNNWIYDYEENNDKDGYYKIIRKKPSNPLPDELL